MNHDIKVSHLTKKFGNVTAIDNVSIDVNDASCVGLLGPNGAGKSTMMKAITNILKPTSGRIEIGGVNVSSNPKKALKEVGSLVEYPKFYPYRTGLESLYFVCRIKGMKRKECQDEIERVAKLTGVSGYLDKKTGSYSRGMNQRVALSSALLCNPRVLILDEPTFGLDPKGMKEMRQLLKKINGEKESIILLSSHLIYEINEVCDRVVIVNGGKVAYDSETPDNEQWMAIKLDKLPEDTTFLKKFSSEFRSDGTRLILKKNEKIPNNEVLMELMEMGLSVESFGEYDTLEDIYISIVDSKR